MVRMTAITLDDLRNDVLYYLQLVEAGETLVVVQSGAPMAEIRPITHNGEAPNHLRPAGLCAGEFTVPEDFDGALPVDVL